MWSSGTTRFRDHAVLFVVTWAATTGRGGVWSPHSLPLPGLPEKSVGPQHSAHSQLCGYRSACPWVRNIWECFLGYSRSWLHLTVNFGVPVMSSCRTAARRAFRSCTVYCRFQSSLHRLVFWNCSHKCGVPSAGRAKHDCSPKCQSFFFLDSLLNQRGWDKLSLRVG